MHRNIQGSKFLLSKNIYCWIWNILLTGDAYGSNIVNFLSLCVNKFTHLFISDFFIVSNAF